MILIFMHVTSTAPPLAAFLTAGIKLLSGFLRLPPPT
jgi:hypothetical protein